MEFSVEFTPEEAADGEEARKQRLANMTDKWPKLASLMNGSTWQEIYALKPEGK